MEELFVGQIRHKNSQNNRWYHILLQYRTAAVLMLYWKNTIYDISIIS